MRITILYVFFFTTYLLDVQAQIYQQDIAFDTEIVYEHRYMSGGLDGANSDKQMMSLLVNDDVSLFQLTRVFPYDSTTIASGHSSTAIMKQAIIFINPLTYRIFKQNNQISTVESITSLESYMTTDFYAYTEKEEMFRWKIQEDTATVDGLFCQRALLNWAGRDWEAWFSPETPIFDGPYKFSGLPGLIVRIEDTEGIYSFALKHISSRKTKYWANVRKDLSYTLSTKEEFFKQRRWFLDNMYEIAVSEGLPPNDEPKQRAIKFAKSYQPMEKL